MTPRLLFVVLVALLLPPKGATAQDDSLRSYYPLEIGNLWQYRVPEGPGWALWTVAVLGDTQFSSGKTYRVIEDSRVSVGRYYERIDSATLNVYRTAGEWDTDHLRDSLRASVGDSLWGVSDVYPLVYDHDSQDTLFGVSVPVKHFLSPVIPDLPRFGYASGFGRSYEKRYVEDPGNPEYYHESVTRLQYARIDGVEYGTLLSVGTERDLPRTARLRQNYPNPFNPSTRISYVLDGERRTTLKVYDLTGREMATLVDALEQPGEHSATWNAQGLPSGVYFYRLTAGRTTESRNMLLLR